MVVTQSGCAGTAAVQHHQHRAVPRLGNGNVTSRRGHNAVAHGDRLCDGGIEFGGGHDGFPCLLDQKKVEMFLACSTLWSSRITRRATCNEPSRMRRKISLRCPAKTFSSRSRRLRYTRNADRTSRSAVLTSSWRPGSAYLTTTLVTRWRVRDGGSSAQAIPESKRRIRHARPALVPS